MKVTTKACSVTAAITIIGSLVTEVNADESDEIHDNNESDRVQFNQGDWLLGFSGSYNSIEADGDNANFVYMNVDFSYFINNSWSLGVSTFGLLIPEGGEIEDTGYAIGLEPNLRRYFQNESKYKTYFGVHAGYAYASIADESESLTTYGLHAGVLFALSQRAYFDAKLKWSKYDLPDVSDVDLSTLQVLVGFKVQF